MTLEVASLNLVTGAAGAYSEAVVLLAPGAGWRYRVHALSINPNPVGAADVPARTHAGIRHLGVGVQYFVEGAFVGYGEVWRTLPGGLVAPEDAELRGYAVTSVAALDLAVRIYYTFEQV